MGLGPGEGEGDVFAAGGVGGPVAHEAVVWDYGAEVEFLAGVGGSVRWEGTGGLEGGKREATDLKK